MTKAITENNRCVALFANGEAIERVEFYLWGIVTTKTGPQPTPLILMDDGAFEPAVSLDGYLRVVDAKATDKEVEEACAELGYKPVEEEPDDDDEDEDDEPPPSEPAHAKRPARVQSRARYARSRK